MDRLCCGVMDGEAGLRAAVMRYAVLERVAEAAGRRGIDVIGFGLGDRELRLVVDGRARDIANLTRGLKVGTSRAVQWRGDEPVVWASTEVEPVDDLDRAVAWAHLAPAAAIVTGPLSTPWTSHRDLLGFRRATFFDGSALGRGVDPRRVHALAGGRALPEGWPPRGRRESLSLLLRVAGGVLGVLPADRRCFRLFVHLARSRGWKTVAMAQALRITERRVRQLAGLPEPFLDLALVSLADARLRLVP